MSSLLLIFMHHQFQLCFHLFYSMICLKQTLLPLQYVMLPHIFNNLAMLIILDSHRLFIMIAHAHEIIHHSHQQIRTALIVTINILVLVCDPN